jgi:hypothetical protein
MKLSIMEREGETVFKNPLLLIALTFFIFSIKQDFRFASTGSYG